MAQKMTWSEIWLDRLPDDRLLTRLLLESFQQHRGKYLLAAGAMILVAVSTALSAWMMGEIIDTLADPSDRGRVTLTALGVFAIFAFRGFAQFAQAVLMARAGNRIVAEKQAQMYDRMLSQGLAFFTGNHSSRLLMRITQGAQAARTIVDVIVSGFVRDALTLLGLIVVMIYQQPFLTLVSFVVAPAILYGLQKILGQVRSVMSEEMNGIAEIIKVVQETSNGVRVVKSFGLDGRMTDRMNDAINDVEERRNKMVQLESATLPLLDVVAGFAIGAIIVLSTVSFFGQAPGTPGQLLSFVTAFLMSYDPARRLSRMRVSIERGMVGVRMMYELLDAPQTLRQHDDATPLADGPGEVRFRDVSFAYGDKSNALTELSITFKAGQTTALVGPSGGGKSTILNLILRLYDPSNGRIEIDGQDIAVATFKSLRDKIAFVGQDTFLFATTIMENLLLARPEASREEVMEAAKFANAHDFIEDLPDGYQTKIGENGASLSGGQRQRLSIARAILRRAPILLLDEATSALDSRSEAAVRDALDAITENVTTIVIAHRLSTVMSADQIYYIEDGMAVEQGTVTELIALNGKFKELYDIQINPTEILVR